MATTIVVSRPSAWFNRKQAYKIYFNGKEVGSVKNDSSEAFEVEPGAYTVKSQLHWMSSPEYNVTVAEGEKVYIKVSNGMKLILPFYILMLIGLFLPLYFNFAKLPMPEYVGIAKLVLILPALVYIVLYTSVLRKKYMLITADTSSPFAQLQTN